MSTTTPSLQQWAKELSLQQMPVLARTAQTIARRAGDDESSASDLAAQVLQDVSMTTRLLRMANSIHFNPQGGKISTVSRAIILLGFNVVRDLCLSISIVDTFLAGEQQVEVAEEMALAFHAALQARRLAEMSRQSDPEEVFIATLLSHLGDLAFLCFGERVIADVRQQLLDMRQRDPAKREEIERQVLGFPIRDLTALLNKEWRLSPLLGVALDPSAGKNARTQILRLGNELAAAMQHGEGTERVESLLAQAAKELGLDLNQLRAQVWKTAEAAAETMVALGAVQASRRVPRPRAAAAAKADIAPAAERSGAANVGAVTEKPSPWNAGDASLQLSILRELSQLLVESRPTVAVLMEMVLEGVFRGVGMDRAVFALLTPDRRQLRAKASLTSEGAALPQNFEFAIGPGHNNPFNHAIQSGEPLWLGSERNGNNKPSVDARTRAICGGHCFVMPLSVGNTAIGCLYADRAASRRELTDDVFGQFKTFGQQARMGLSFIKAR